MLCGMDSFAQRIRYTINDNWRFSKTEDSAAAQPAFDDSTWESVSIPHTWNAEDATDETPGYYRGKGWYRNRLILEAPQNGRQTYLYGEGANQWLKLYVNGKAVGEHKGGYTAFCFDITPYIKAGENLLALCVDNSHQPDIPPLAADFTFFGGIYRDLYLIQTAPNHITTTHYASSGVYLKTPHVDRQQATVEIRTLLTNNRPSREDLWLEHTVVSPSGELVASTKSPIDTRQKELQMDATVQIPDPELWSADSPRLYTVRSKVVDGTGTERDCVVNPLGLRWYEFDPQKGFFLNGSHLKLIGTCRHQDYLKKGNALSDQMHIRDIRLLKEMGGNFLRVSHYPQDPTVMEMCDKLGILTSVEIPIVNAVTMSDAFLENSLEMAREMVFQNMNHPSVIIWAYMNEVMINPPYRTDPTIREEEYLAHVNGVASRLDNELKHLDAARYTMTAFHGSGAIYQQAGLTEIPQIHGWNMYSGWYGGKFSGFEHALDKFRGLYPDKILMVSEYGADADPRLHSFEPESFDFSCEYALLMHRHYLKQILKNDFVSISSLWNLNDFYSELRQDAVPTVNSKGITGLDRARKDSYYLYQAHLSPKPMVHIGNRAWVYRAAQGNAKGEACQPVTVISNAPRVELLLNNRSLGIHTVEEGVATYSQVPFRNGENRLEAIGYFDRDTVKDFCCIRFDVIAPRLNDPETTFKTLNVLLGSKRYFEDRVSETCWIPEQAYVPGSWGYVGGEARRPKTKYGSLPASSMNILGTDADPIFQTQREGIESFKADVPDGSYSVYLYFAELDSNQDRSELVYNLDNNAVSEGLTERIFNVWINGKLQLPRCNIARQYGVGRAVIRKIEVNVLDGKGLSIDFEPIEGSSILNAISIIRNY